MRLTNNTNLPETLKKVAEKLYNSHPVFENDKFSVTELLKSDQQVILARRHADDIEIDVQDTFSMWNGTAIHGLLEASAGDKYITEMRLEEDFGDVAVSGGFDLLDKETWTLYDYKTCKVAGYQKAVDGVEDKWLRQLYAYADLIEHKFGKRPTEAVIVAMMTDHSKIKAETQEGYPLHPIMEIRWMIDNPELQAEFRADREERARRLKGILESGNEPAPCNFGDMWCKEDYAVFKEGAKRATKCFDNEAEARAFIEGKKDLRLHHRVSDFINCKYYCQCRDVCPQWQALKASGALDEDITDRDYIPF